jgi:hypothetical protein
MRWARHVGHSGMRTDEYRGLVGKPVGKGQLEKSRHRGTYNIRMDVKETF